MVSDAVVLNPGRMRILLSLAASGAQEFVQLRADTRLTDGNLVTHARRLESAGLIRSDRAQREGRSVTRFTLTDAGRTELRRRAEGLMQALQQVPASPPQTHAERDEPEEVWID